MDLTYISLLVFLITTLFYFYYFKLPLTLKKGLPGQAVASPAEVTTNDMPEQVMQTGGAFVGPNDTTFATYGEYATSNMSRLLMFFVIVVMEQFGFNLATIVDKCGGTVGKNIAMSMLMTVVPWSLVFGSVIMLLIVYPGLKSAFSDVIGYFFVYSEADEILGTLIVDTNIEDTINKAKAADATPDGKQSDEMKKAAEAIMKMCGNKGILINTMNPENYEDIWSVLSPLMSPTVSEGQKEEYKSRLFDLIVKKDNIGEGMWYIYTGLFLSSIVSYNVIARGCSNSVANMKDQYKKHLNESKDKVPDPSGLKTGITKQATNFT
jgi:hypothetical protein